MATSRCVAVRALRASKTTTTKCRLRTSHNRAASAQRTPTARHLHLSNSEASTPPFLVRAGLVGSVTAVCTPVFPVVGAYRLAAHVVPSRNARFLLVGSAAGIFSFAFRDALPALVDHAELLAPAAAANGAVAAATYGLLEAAHGGPRRLLDGMARVLPKASPAWLLAAGPAAAVGAAVGAATGVLAPYTYAPLFGWHFGVDAPELGRLVDRLLPVAAPTGFVAGAVLGPVLKPAIAGVSGVPWVFVALPGVVAVVAVCVGLFKGAREPRPLSGEDDLVVGETDRARRVGPAAPRLPRRLSRRPRLPQAHELERRRRRRPRVDDGGASPARAWRRARSSTAPTPGRRVYGDARPARLDVALSRFPALAARWNLSPDAGLANLSRCVASPTKAELRQRAALTTDAVARAAVLAGGGEALDAETVLAEFRFAVDTMKRRGDDEATTARHLEDPRAFDDVARYALAACALLRTKSDGLSDADRATRLELYRHTTSPSTPSVVDLRELDALLKKHGVALDPGLWPAYQTAVGGARRGGDVRRRRRGRRPRRPGRTPAARNRC
ncbi:hypothetical protein JL720_4232 [Aureococcus anophagefferens]|nr:hypothetical protein JL720_4232 [Aureococcus anophagefferens]